MTYEDKKTDLSCNTESGAKLKKTVNVMIGPPSHKGALNDIMSQFFSSEGAHIICGGTTSMLAADYLGAELQVSLDYVDCTIPPAAHIDGVDFVTEGIVTLSMVLERADRLLESGNAEYRLPEYKDAVSGICRILFDEADEIRFFIGTAINKAHQKPGSGINFSKKMLVIADLIDRLCRMGKHVAAQYY